MAEFLLASLPGSLQPKVAMFCSEEESHIARKNLAAHGRDEARDHSFLSRFRTGTVECDALGFGAGAERIGDLVASENIAQKFVMIVAENEQIPSVLRS